MARTLGPGRRIAIGESIRFFVGKIKSVVPVHTHTTTPGTGGPIAGAAPIDAEYIVGASNATLTAERVVTDTATVTWDLTVAGQAKANAVSGISYGSPTGAIDIGDAQSDGVASTVPRSDHQHAFPAPSTGYPVDADFNAEADGTATTPARSDHRHHVTTPAAGYPQDVAGTEADGTATNPARADHVHKGVASVNGQVGAVVIGGSGGTSPGQINDPATTSFTCEDFTEGSTEDGEIGGSCWGDGGNAPAFAQVAGHPGCITISSTGSNLLRDIRERVGTTGSWHSDDTFDITMKFRLNVNDSNTIASVGFYDNPGTDPTNGVYFEKAAADTNWWFVTRDGGVGTETRTDSTIAVNAGAWMSIRIRRIDSTHIGGTIKEIGGSTGGEFSHTTHLPSIAANRAFKIKSISGTKSMDCDYADLLITGLAR